MASKLFCLNNFCSLQSETWVFFLLEKNEVSAIDFNYSCKGDKIEILIF